MKKRLRLLFLLLVLFTLGSVNAHAQAAFASEEELKTQAAKLFDEDEFEEAYPLYSQLLSLYPKDPNYNFRLGVCMLYASDDKEKAIPFLEYASKKADSEKEVFFFLARAFHLNYRFDDAIGQYIAYKKVASEAKAEKLMVDRQIEMCKNGKKLLRNLTDLIVIDKKEMSRADFYRSYDISDLGGKLLAKPDEPAFKTAVDKKKKEKSIIYLATNNNQVYFSSYGDNTDQGKDIYIIRKLPTGDWSKPQTLGYPVNTEYDEDFPFLHPNGKVLYFCSKGHNSMGGYDIFKTTLNEETGTWNKPVNMDFPINTPDDDNLYVTNADEKEAYFSSARSSPTGKTAVFHINVERKPIDVAIIKGYVLKNRDNQAIDVKITVKDLGDNTILGIYNSKADNGSYLINLPNGGKFMYTVEATGFATQSEVVLLPTQYEFKPLKQEISYELGTDKLIVKNLFDEPVDEGSYLLALNFIKERAKMETSTNPETSNATSTNTTEVAVKTTENKTENNTENSKPQTNTSLTNDDIVKIAQNDAVEAEKEAKDLQEQADIALTLANLKNELAQNKEKEATQLMADAKGMDDNVKKQATVNEANEAFKEADQLNQETVAAFNIAKKLQFKAMSKEEEADLSKQYAKDLEAAVKSKNPEEAMVKLDEQEKKLEELSKRNGKAEPDDIFSGLKLDEANKKRELDKAKQLSVDLKQEMTDNEALMLTLKEDADKTKKEDLKKGLLDQIAGLKDENVEKKKELEANELKIAQIQKEYNGVKNEMVLVNNVVDKSKTGTSEEASTAVASIDKTKLEAQVNEIKNSTTENVVAVNTTENKTSTTEVTPVNTTTTEAKTTDVAVNTTENKTTENTTSETNTTENTTTANVEPVRENYNQKFRDAIAAADNIPNELERETKKADLYKEWKAATDADVTEKKLALKNEKDKTKKKELSTEVAQLEKGVKDLDKSVKTAVASVEKIKKDQSVAVKTTENKTTENATTNTTTENTSASTTENTTNTSETVETVRPANINAKYTETVAEADKIADATERNKAKADALNQWSAAIDADIEKKKLDMAASADPEMKALLAKKISDAEILSKEKKAEADRLSGTAVVATTNTTTENKTANTTEVAVNTAENKTSTTEVTPVNTTTTEAKTSDVAVNTTENKTSTTEVTPVNTTTTEAKTTDVAVNTTENKTSTTEVTPVNTTTTEAKTTDVAVNTTENKTTENTTENKTAETSTENKTSENTTTENTTATVVYTPEELSAKSDANTKEITSNQALLEQYAVASSQNKSDEVSMAEMMKDEAKIYAERAKKSRDLANGAGSAYDKEAALEDAIKNEAIALDKQAKAVALYKKNNPDFVPGVTPVVAANTTENKTSTTEVTPVNTTTTEAKTTDVAVNTTENKTTENKTTENKTTENKTTDVAVNTTENKTSTTEVTPVNTSTTEAKTTDVAVNTTENKTTDVAVNTTENKTSTTEVTPVNTSTTEAKTTDVAVNTSENKTAETVNTAAATTTLEPTEKFERTNQPVYSAAKPIPVNVQLPEGLVFKVQIGAFRNPIAPETFKGMSPINAETTPQGFTRYTAGLFKKLSTAEKVKDEIRGLGYKDAFVVAFLNGKRISMSQALAMAGGIPPENTSSANTSAEVATTTNVQPTNTNVQPTATSTNEQNTTVAESKSVSSVGGLFYTVQVGVYSQPVTSAKIKNCKPLYSEQLPNGTIRYTTGIFNDLSAAVQAKNKAVNAGIADAFVSAYINGKRISMPEAENLVKQGTGFSNAEGMNVQPSFGGGTASQPVQPKPTPQPVNTPVPENTPQPTNTPVNVPVNTPVTTTTTTNDQPVAVTAPTVSAELKAEVEKSNTMQVEPGLVYKIQIGAFKDEVPLDIANKFLKIANKGIRNFKDENGLTIYSVGSYKTYEEASAAKTEVVNASGVNDAFITAYNEGKKITIDEAKLLQK